MEIQELKEKPLSLTNNGELELFFIGVGSAFAQTLFQTNFLIIKGSTHILVDFGMTGPQALFATAGLKPTDIEVFFPTHSHADHVGGIECLGLMNRYVGRPFMKKPKMTAIVSEEYQRILWDNTLRGGMEWNEEEKDPYRHLAFGDYFNVVRPIWKTHQPREIYEIDFNGIRLEIFRTKHTPDTAKSWETSFISYGLLIDNRIFVSGDTRFDSDLIDMYSHRAEVMYHDCQFFPGGVHAPLADLQTLPDAIKAKMYLIHYGDNWRDQNIDGFAGFAQQEVQYIFD